MAESYIDAPPPGPLADALATARSRLRRYLDAAAPHVGPRWAGLALGVLAYGARVYTLKGFHIVTYALAIYNLNLLLGFLTPQIDPELEGPTLPSAAADEFRPFVRRLPEFKFWWAATRSFALGMLATCFPVLDVPVFWPILVAYFFALFFVTMKRQIKHMLKHRYVPFSFGKKSYGKGGATARPVE